MVGAAVRLGEHPAAVGPPLPRRQLLRSLCLPPCPERGLVCTLERSLKVFRMTGLTKVFTICDNDAAALAVLQESREVASDA